jgi:predicted ATPase
VLDRIRLNNFKAARNLDLPLAPLTMLAGLNGSGKSTVLQSLAAIRQSYQVEKGSGLELRGPLVPLGQGIDVLSEGATDETITVAIMDESTEYRWVCKVQANANQLEFIKCPSKPHRFVTMPEFQYLQADRIVPRTLYPQADQQARQAGFLGSHGEYTADFLARNYSQLVPEKRRCQKDSIYLDETLWAQIAPTSQLLDQVAGWLQQISPGAHLQAEPLKGTDDVMLQFRYIGSEHGRSGSYRPTHVGFGLTYSLPILVACLAAPSGSLLLIENPEAHLHPQGQAKVGELLALCAADGVQILVETHSDHVLNGIRLSVKNGSLNASDVRLCYFTRNVSSGDCYVELPSVLPDGQLTNWPVGFFDQWEKSLDALLR